MVTQERVHFKQWEGQVNGKGQSSNPKKQTNPDLGQAVN